MTKGGPAQHLSSSLLEQKLHAGSLCSPVGDMHSPRLLSCPPGSSPTNRPHPFQGVRPSHWVDASCRGPLLHPEPRLVTAQGCTAQPQGSCSHTACADGVPKPVTCTTWSLQSSRPCPDPRLASLRGPLNHSENHTAAPVTLATEGTRRGCDAPYGTHPLSSA